MDHMKDELGKECKWEQEDHPGSKVGLARLSVKKWTDKTKRV